MCASLYMKVLPLEQYVCAEADGAECAGRGTTVLHSGVRTLHTENADKTTEVYLLESGQWFYAV